jgi:hypothetical protein
MLLYVLLGISISANVFQFILFTFVVAGYSSQLKALKNGGKNNE